jgi:hypothetical protein
VAARYALQSYDTRHSGDSGRAPGARVAREKDVDVVGFGRVSVHMVATDDNCIQHLQRRRC